MSGPKVVRIVTREEMLEISRGHLARVDAALDEWTKVGRRNECIDDEALASAHRRREALAALISDERFLDLQSQASAEEEFLRSNMQERLAKAAAAQAAAHSHERRVRETGASLLRSLHAAGVEIDRNLERGLLSGAAQALSEGFQLMADCSLPAPKASNELAAGFREEGTTQSFGSWLDSQPASPSDPATARIERRLVELGQMLDEDGVAEMRARLNEIETAPHARRSLLLDGLEVESGRRLKAARRHEALLVELRLTLAECTVAGLHVEEEAEGCEQIGADLLEVRIDAMRNALESTRAAAAAAMRRAAVLEGLSTLGYQVAEGMSTATPEDGRLLMRSAARPGYGVEVNSAGSSGRMQMRPVAFDNGGHGPDPARDKDAETIWCGDVSKLQEHFNTIGGGLSIEKALPVGAVALKRVELADARSDADLSTPLRQERSRST